MKRLDDSSDAAVVWLHAATWQIWSDKASDVVARAKRTANWTFALAALGTAALGYVLLDGHDRYPAIIYAPVVGFAAWLAAGRAYVVARFSETADSMRELLVPDLLNRATGVELLRLAARGGVVAENKIVRAREADGMVCVEAELGEMLPAFVNNWATWGGAGL